MRLRAVSGPGINIDNPGKIGDFYDLGRSIGADVVHAGFAQGLVVFLGGGFVGTRIPAIKGYL